jgi:hypothetical protein
MFRQVRSALQARRAAMVEAEVLVFRFGARGVAIARSFAEDSAATETRRRHYREVARLAARRHRELADLDAATRYIEVARWQQRRATGESGMRVVS